MNNPARQLIKPTTPRTVHLLNLSGALTRPVQAEASTEADFVRLAALCPNVINIVSQPETFDLPTGQYTPDYRIECKGGRISYWEVKLERRINEYRDTFGAMAVHLSRRSARFFVISNVSIRRRSQHKTAQLLHRYAKAALPLEVTEQVLLAASNARAGISLADLCRQTQVPEEQVYHLLARRQLTFKKRVAIGDTDLLIDSNFVEHKDELLLADWLGVSAWRANP